MGSGARAPVIFNSVLSANWSASSPACIVLGTVLITNSIGDSVGLRIDLDPLESTHLSSDSLWTGQVEVRNPVRGGDFLFTSVHTGPGGRRASYTMGTGCFFYGDILVGAWH